MKSSELTTSTCCRKSIVLVFLCLIAACFCHSAGGQQLARIGVLTAGANSESSGSWRFIVSGDSRNCGDVIVPAIAANSAQFSPTFYWHLGDLRAIYKIDEDIAFAADKNHTLSCTTYHKIAWDDFIEHQIGAFGKVPFFVGIGNHEIIPPKTEADFKREFARWLDVPVLHEQRQKDKEPATPETYYHWIQHGVDFIYLDNASNAFSGEELAWFGRRLDAARADDKIKSIVVGMHEALPDSVANSHSMGDRGPDSPGTISGEQAYKALVDFRDQSKKPVYILSSHSHFYMENIFDTPKLTANDSQPLPGWIVGTAGAVRYALPAESRPTAITDVYGYLMGTVAANGTIAFSFHELHESDVPQNVRERYTNAMIPWCFAHNSQNKEPKAPDITPRCPVTQQGSAASQGSHP
jgi:hypothetical protein